MPTPHPFSRIHPCDSFSCGAHDHFQSALLSRPPDVGWFAAQGGFIEVSLRHAVYYILHVLIAYAKILLYDELITERTEKWATPTFLLVIRK